MIEDLGSTKSIKIIFAALLIIPAEAEAAKRCWASTSKAA